MPRRLVPALAVTLAAALTASCDGSTGPSSFEPGALGAVTVLHGEAVKIRSLLAMTGASFLGEPARRGIELAVRDVATIRGRSIQLGEAVDSACSPEGGSAGARGIVADPQVAGVIGTSCSAGALAASPVIGQAGFAMVAPNNTSPLLTSDLAGNPNPAYHHGYYRVANNDLHQARALSDFADNERLPVVYRFTP